MSFFRDTIRKNMATVMVNGFGAVLLFASTSMLTRSLGAAEYGRLAFALTIGYLIAMFATIGLPVAAHKIVGIYYNRQQWRRVTQYILVSTVIALVLTPLLTIPLHYILPHIMKNPDELAFPLRELLMISLSLSLVRLLTELARAVQYPILSAFIETIVARLVIFVGVGWFLYQQQPLNAIEGAWFYIGGNLVAIVMFMALMSYAIQHQWRSFTPAPMRLSRAWSGQAMAMMISPIFFFIMSQIDVFIIGLLSTAEETGSYQVASRLANFVIFVWGAITPVMLSKFSVAHKAADWQRAQQAVDLTNIMGGLPTIGIVIGIILFGKDILNIFGAEFVAAYPVLVILSLGKMIDVLFGPSTEYLMMTGHHRLVSKVNIIAALVNITLNVPLIMHYGAIGAALATAIALFLWKCALSTIAIRLCPIKISALQRITGILAARRAA